MTSSMQPVHKRALKWRGIVLIGMILATGLFLHRQAAPAGAAQPFLIVSMGDSSASGEGNPDIAGQGCVTPGGALITGTVASLLGGALGPVVDLYQGWYLASGALGGNSCSTPPQWLGSQGTGSLGSTLDAANDQRCHRSQRSGHRLAANAFQAAHPGLAVQFYTVACSGATIKAWTSQDVQNGEGGLISPYKGVDPSATEQQQVNWMKSQVDQVAEKVGSRQIDALVINIGVNDVGFGHVVESCILDLTGCQNDTDLNNLVSSRLQALPDALDALATAISQKLKVANIYLTAYPNPTRMNPTTYCNFGPFGDVLSAMSANNVSWAEQSVLVKLNGALSTAAGDHAAQGWHFVSGTETSTFFNHGYCNADSGTSNRWFLSMNDAFLTQGDWNGSLHPNAGGHAVYASSIKSALDQQYTAPPVPANLRVKTINPLQIVLEWDNNAGNAAAALQLAWKPATDTTYNFGSLARNSTVTGLTFLPANLYDFYVRACTAVVCSGWSNGLRVPTMPGAPSNLQGFGTTKTVPVCFNGICSGFQLRLGIQLSWQDNSSTEQAFQIAYRRADLSTYSFVQASAGSSGLFVSGLDAGAPYVFWIRACGLSTNCSGWTGNVTATNAGPAATGVGSPIVVAAPSNAPAPTVPALTAAPPPDAAPIPLLPGASVGTASITPDTTTVKTGDRVTYTFGWVAPEPLVWRDLRTLELRIVDAQGEAMLIHFDQLANTFSLMNEQSGKLGPAFTPGSRNVLETNTAKLYLADSKVVGSGPTGQSVNLVLSLSFKPKAAGRTFGLEALGTDDLGRNQGFDPVGTVQVN